MHYLQPRKTFARYSFEHTREHKMLLHTVYTPLGNPSSVNFTHCIMDQFGLLFTFMYPPNKSHKYWVIVPINTRVSHNKTYLFV